MGRPPLKPTVAKQPPAQNHLKNMSIKEMMSGKSQATNKTQLLDEYDVNIHQKEPYYQYLFFSQLFTMVRRDVNRFMPNDQAVVRQVYNSKKADFIKAKPSAGNRDQVAVDESD